MRLGNQGQPGQYKIVDKLARSVSIAQKNTQLLHSALANIVDGWQQGTLPKLPAHELTNSVLKNNLMSFMGESIGGLGELAVPVLLEKLPVTTGAAQLTVIKALGYTLDSTVIPVLIAELGSAKQSNNVDLQRAIIFALGHLQHTPAKDLLEFLTSSNDHIQRVTSGAIHSSLHASFDVFVSGLQHKHPLVQDVSFKRLANYYKRHDDQIIQQLVDLLDKPDANLRQRVVTLLGKVGNSNTAEHIIRATKDPNEAVKAAAIKALGVNSPAVFMRNRNKDRKQLQKIYNNEDGYFKYLAAKALETKGATPLEAYMILIACHPYLKTRNAIDDLVQHEDEFIHQGAKSAKAFVRSNPSLLQKLKQIRELKRIQDHKYVHRFSPRTTKPKITKPEFDSSTNNF